MRDKPKPPELIPGLPAENARRLQGYWEDLACWKADKAEPYQRRELSEIEGQSS